ITHADLKRLRGSKVLLRAHGEPPETYRMAKENNIEIVDATCPVVLKLQQRIKAAYSQPSPPQIVIYGKIGHAEVNGLVGQTDGTAIVVEHEGDLDKIDFNRPVALYSQTTKSVEGFRAIADRIRQRIAPDCEFTSYDTICRSVSKRVDRLREFAASHDVIIFVAGTKSSNGKILFNHCLEVNPRSFMIPNESALQQQWLEGAESIGICGATSTPRWLMERVRDKVR
ncbi:MAG: 4-hydroxy-3-methylbut-2-enyl diphosphate reductase, partial [Muribaculaceae bacterium]|nr:4-hydroxy-3-methylbut-2-enyl diphosphate reductase [Muribaculaceae bacterium]